MINYYCPSFYENQITYYNFLLLQEEHPECFYDNVKIHSVYGCFPNMIWNGGTYDFGCYVWKNSFINKLFTWYQNKNINIQLTLTNPCLEKTDIYDRYCNNILEIGSNYNNVEILICSPILEEYIRNNYPNIRINKSIVSIREKTEYTLNDIISDLENNNYNKIVLPHKYNKDINFLNSIPQQYRNRIELLVNENCPSDCPRLYQHYTIYGKTQLLKLDVCDEDLLKCSNPKIKFFKEHDNRENVLEYEDLLTYELNHYTEIKISGRSHSAIMGIIELVYYLIKPEYQKDVFYKMFNYFSNLAYDDTIFDF